MGSVKSYRLEWVDIARGIVMLCVILGHMNVGWIKTVIFSFHMPFFFLLSGYFQRKTKFAPLLKSSAKRLLVPYLFTGCCLIVLSCARNALKIFMQAANVQPPGHLLVEWIKALLLGSGGRKDFLLIHSEITVGAIWFLLAMFLAQLCVNVFIEKPFGFLWISALAAAGIFTANYFWLPLSVQSAAVASVFVAIGYLYQQRGHALAELIKGKYIVVTCSVIWLAYVVLTFVFPPRLSIAAAEMPKGPLDYLGSTAGTIVILWLSHILSRVSVLRLFLSWFGKNSLIVLCFHLIEMTIIPFHGGIDLFLSKIGLYSWILSELLTFLVKVIWVCCSIWVVYRLKPLRFVFGIKNPRKATIAD